MYGKIFESMYDGTLASKGPWQALVTFQQLIVLADQDGVVDMTAHAISRRTSIPLEVIEVGITELMKPDPDSRTPDEDGRRIMLVEEHRNWGWQIVNHAKYRDMRKAEDRREYLRLAQAKSRDRRKSTPVNTRQQMSTNVIQSTDTDTDADTDALTPLPPSQKGAVDNFQPEQPKQPRRRRDVDPPITIAENPQYLETKARLAEDEAREVCGPPAEVLAFRQALKREVAVNVANGALTASDGQMTLDDDPD